MKKRTLLLSCCAPCSCVVIKEMAQNGDDFAVLFYNPNIVPFEEYRKRLDENKKVCELYSVSFIELPYDNDRWAELTKGLENEPEQGKRCSVCFHMRVKRAMEYAKDNGFDAVASVLGVSRYKDIEQVNVAAMEASCDTGVPYIDLGKGSEIDRNVLRKELDLYAQRYCGCKPR